AQPQVHEQHQHEDPEYQPVPRSEVEQVELPDPWEVGGVDRADAEVARGQGLAPAQVHALPVDRDHADDLPEGERDDGDVVAAQAQGGQPDDDARDRAYGGGGDQDQDEVKVDTNFGGGHSSDPDVHLGLEK